MFFIVQDLFVWGQNPVPSSILSISKLYPVPERARTALIFNVVHIKSSKQKRFENILRRGAILYCDAPILIPNYTSNHAAVCRPARLHPQQTINLRVYSMPWEFLLSPWDWSKSQRLTQASIDLNKISNIAIYQIENDKVHWEPMCNLVVKFCKSYIN